MRNVPDIAAMEIKRLRDDGVKVTDDDVVWLASLGYKVENPRGQTLEAAGLVEGIRLSDNTFLKPLTVCASKWLKRYGNLFSDASDPFAVAFAMANPDKTAELKNAKDSISAVCEWTASLRVSHSELVRALACLLSDDSPTIPDAKKMDSEKIIAMLVSITGLPFEYWEKQQWIKVNDAYSGAIRYAIMLNENYENPDSVESKEALREMLFAIKEIRERK